MTQNDFRKLAFNVMVLFIYTLAMYNTAILVVAGIFTACLFLLCVVDVLQEQSIIDPIKYDNPVLKYIGLLIDIVLISVLWHHQAYVLVWVITFVLVYGNVRVNFIKSE